MVLIDSLMLSGLCWVLETVAQAAEAELNDDTVLREILLAAGARLAAGEISEDEFAQVEETVLARIRQIRSSRGADTGPIAWTEEEEELEVEAALVGDFHDAPRTPVLPRAAQRRQVHEPRRPARRKP